MSNSEHSLDRQKRRHAGPLIGMALVVILAMAGLFWWLSYEAAEAPGPTGADVQIDGRTGAESGAESTGPAEDAATTPLPRSEAAAQGEGQDPADAADTAP